MLLSNHYNTALTSTIHCIWKLHNPNLDSKLLYKPVLHTSHVQIASLFMAFSLNTFISHGHNITSDMTITIINICSPIIKYTFVTKCAKEGKHHLTNGSYQVKPTQWYTMNSLKSGGKIYWVACWFPCTIKALTKNCGSKWYIMYETWANYLLVLWPLISFAEEMMHLCGVSDKFMLTW